ncbi:MAG TPA: hypothetical protein VGF55_17380 [Gemmataceae bacterium]|jgi:hypothetical protein
MTDADRFRLLFGTYCAPRWRYGRVVMDDLRGEVTIVGMTAGRIPWPVGKRGPAKAPVVAAGLARALRAESAQAVAHWWGLSAQTVCLYRRALGVPRSTAGSRRLWQINCREVITPEVQARAVRAANTPEANARKGAAQRGKPLPEHLKKHFDRTGWVPSAETRARMSAAQKSRDRNRQGGSGPAWSEEEDALLDRLSPAEVAARTGRSIGAIYLRRRRLRRARGETARPPARPWTAGELALLGTMADEDLGARIGRPVNAVRVMRSRRGVPTFADRRRGPGGA